MTLQKKRSLGRKNKAPILAKLAKPNASQAWPRERLFSLLDQSFRSPLVWISAPAGSGKTTLVSNYLESRKIRSLWYQIDQGDRDIATFFHYLGLAAQGMIRGDRVLLPHPSQAQYTDLEVFTRNYLRELYSHIGSPAVLAFDNYHEANSPLLDNIMRCAVGELPPGIKMIVLSRQPPPAAFSVLRVNGSLAVIENNDMKLNIDETEGIVRHMGAAASDVALERWHDMTQGWIAGLILIVQKARTGDSRDRLETMKELLFDYFSDQIFSRIPLDRQEVLLKAAFLPTMTPTGIDVLTGLKDNWEILERLYLHNYFTSKHQTSYQFHPLFRDFLLNKARRIFLGETLDAVRLRAAEVSLMEGKLDDAADLFIEAKNWRELIRVILEHAAEVVGQGRLNTLERWITSAPSDFQETEPWLGYWLGVCHLPYDPDQARRDFETSMLLFHKKQEFKGYILSWAKMLDAILQDSNDFSRYDKPIALIDSILTEENLASLPPGTRLDIIRSAFIALFTRQPGHPRIPELEQQMQTLRHACSDINLHVVCIFYLSMYYGWSGMFEKMRALVDSLRSIVGSPSLQPLPLSMAKTTEGLAYWLVDADFDRCLKEMASAIKHFGDSGVHIWDTHFIGHAAAAAISKGDIDTAGELLERMEKRLPQSRMIDSCFHRILVCWYIAARGDIGLAQIQINRLEDICTRLNLPYGSGLCHTGYAMLIGHRGPEYEKHTAAAMKMAREHRNVKFEFIVLIAEIRKNLEGGGEEEALKLMRQALAIGRENRIFNCYYWNPSFMAQVCARALAAGIENEYVRDLIRNRNLMPQPSSHEFEAWPWPVKIYTLGRFSIVLNDQTLEMTLRSRYAKPVALLKALIAFGGREVDRDALTDGLWPNTRGDLGRQTFDTTLHRLRELIGKETLLLEDEKLTLNPHRCWCDLWIFHRLMGQLDRILCLPAPKPELISNLTEKVFRLFGGPFLKESGAEWALGPREQVHTRFVKLLEKLGRLWEERQDWGRALICYQKGLAVDPFV